MSGLVIGHTRMGSFTSSIISFGLLACLNILILVHDPQFAASVGAQCDNIGKAMIVAVQLSLRCCAAALEREQSALERQEGEGEKERGRGRGGEGEGERRRWREEEGKGERERERERER